MPAREASALNIPDYKISTARSYILVERSRDYEVVWSEQPAMLRELAAFCDEVGCRQVLIVGRQIRVKLSTIEIYDLGQAIAKLGLLIAVVELHDASGEDVRFLEDVATSRGGPLRFFDTEQDATNWLGVEGS